MRGALLASLTGCTLGFAGLSCNNSHVFQIVEPCATPTLEVGVDVDQTVATDILLVIDNSGSMCEEQENLVANFFDVNCPITDLANIPEEWRNPTPAQVAALSTQCGFIQILAAYENDFRVGVITTDVGECDNRFGFAQSQAAIDEGLVCDGQLREDWGRRPQRGCLQAPPGAEKRFIARGDDDIGARFQSTLDNIRTYGSSIERGLDATQMFLDPATVTAPGCESDRASFLRDEAQLIVIYVTDEDDCSHNIAEDFPDEDAQADCAREREIEHGAVRGEWCYERRQHLKPVSGFASFLTGVKGVGRERDVRVAVIAGALRNDAGGVEPASCRVVNDEPDGQCTQPLGLSNFTTNAAARCNPTRLEQAGLPVCCEADPGTRYFELARALPAGQGFTDTICYTSFRNTMVSIAQFAARRESVELTEAPASPAAIEVRVRRANAAEETIVARIPTGEATDGRDGWQLDGDRTVRFYGSAVPQPGDEIRVSALAKSEGGPAACNGGDSTAPPDGGDTTSTTDGGAP